MFTGLKWRTDILLYKCGGGGVLLQVYLSYNNVSALKTLASQKKWRLSSEKDKVSDISLFLVDRVVLFFSFTDSLYLVLGSSLQS